MFPGTFDPLTVAHVAVAEAALAALGLDEVHLSLSEVGLGKEHLPADQVADRAAAARSAVEGRPGLDVVVTPARLLADIATGYDAVVLGADKLAQVLDPVWYADDAAFAEALRRLPTLAVAARAGTDLAPMLGPGRQAADLDVVVLDLPAHLAEVSASAVRAGRHDWAAGA